MARRTRREIEFDSTTVTLSTAVPRPVERRTDERISAMLRVAKLTDASGMQQLIKVKNLSAGGLMAIAPKCPEVGQQVQRRAIVAKDSGIGDLDSPRHCRIEIRPEPRSRRAARRIVSLATAFVRVRRDCDITCKASVRVGKLYYSVDVHDISLEGMKVEPIEEYCVGKKVIVVVESLRPVKGEVRWYNDRRAGIVFDKPLDFEELSEWVGKRLELASLKAAYKN